MYDVSLSLHPHMSNKSGQSEFTEIIHISTSYVYKRLFSSPSENICSPTDHASVYMD